MNTAPPASSAPVLPAHSDGCSGCGLCESVCPKGAIRMLEDNAGFLRPVVDTERCIFCKVCEKYCHKLTAITPPAHTPNCYAGYAKDSDIRRESTSGGIISTLARCIIRKGGIVFAVSEEDNTDARYICVETEDDLPKLRGSRYVQAYPSKVYKSLRARLREQRPVLFIGLPCQCRALRALLGNEEPNLYCIDLACFGVPSRQLSRAWSRRLEKENDPIARLIYRDKSQGWRAHGTAVRYRSGYVQHIAPADDIFSWLFGSGLALCDSCYPCNRRLNQRVSDISAGDYWGNREFDAADEFSGLSSVAVHTAKGARLLQEANEELNLISLTLADIERQNSGMREPCRAKPEARCDFLRELPSRSCSELTSRFCSGRKAYHLFGVRLVPGHSIAAMKQTVHRGLSSLIRFFRHR